MTTNNHPAHGPVSLERLHQIRQYIERNNQYQNGGNIAYILADMLKVVNEVLAGRSAEPVADVVAWSSPNEERTCDIRWRRHDIALGPLYTAPPAPVVHDDLLSMAASAIEDLLDHTDPSTSYCSGVWADVPGKLRAAMLQAGNSPVIPDGWQLVPKKITLEMECAISRADSYEIGWQWALAAAPKYEVK